MKFAARLLVLIEVVAVLTPGPLAAQEYGRWWWDARIELGERQTDGLVDGQRVRRFAEQEVELVLGLNGFLGDPALGNFRLGLDLLLGDYDGARLTGSDRFGMNLSINLLPRGAYPASLSYRRSLFESRADESIDLFSLLGIVDVSDQWGARLRMRRGPLRGTLLGFERSETTFLNPLTDEEVRDRQFLDWSRSGKKLNNHFRIERTFQDFGTVDLEIDGLTANFDQNGRISPTLRWQLAGIGVQRDVTVLQQTVATEDYRLRGLLAKELRHRDQFEVRYDIGRFESGDDFSRDIQGISASYRWRSGAHWEIAPFAAYTEENGAGFDQTTPRAGVAVSWRLTETKLATVLSGRMSLGEIERRQGSETHNDSQAAYSLAASIRHGLHNGLRKEIEAEASRNELEFDRDPVAEVPDVILPRGLSTEDHLRARATLGWRQDGRNASAWAEWSRREASARLATDDFVAETVRATVQGGTVSASLRLEAGETDTSTRRFGAQTVRFAGVVATWKPLRQLRLQALYRIDERDLVLTPDLDSTRTEAGVEWSIGAIRLEAQAFERRQRIAGGSRITNRGFRWTVSRGLAGWLPIVTGTGRKGVIR